ncbi:MAG: methionine--tRNA ligase [Anaerolineales bacterium]|nr:methionine--tRNA ligase [Anaerolineales bacterium]MCB9172581.1 methionine--tRNA ligase [Ardenticatenales bacterium]
MSDTIAIFVAWPYANGDSHLGHIAGAYLPADIFARYHRLRGNRVLMVSGSDTHGTPITVRAKQAGISPREIYEHYHDRFLGDWQQLGITFDLFTHTDTANHHTIAQQIFRRLYDEEVMFLGMEKQLYDREAGQFLADRYVEGTCPHCGYAGARGDQCDHCGRTLDAVELIDPRSKLTGSRPEIRETEQFFIDLPAYEAELTDYVEGNEHWRPTVRNFVLGWLREGLQPRAMSRDISWGIPLPIEGYEEKVMYVWFEAVIGYISAAVEWAKNRGTPDEWEAWWKNPDARSYYFIGKDNTPFHTVLWGTELLGYDRSLNLPYDVPANEYLNLEGEKFSTSRNYAVWLPDFLERYDPDPLRYYLTAIAPETKDADFKWEEFVLRNNSELVAAWGNLVNRVLGFAYKRYDGIVPTPGDLDDADQALLSQIEQGFARVGELYERVRLRDALREALALVREVNGYLERKSPWKVFKSDPAAAGTTIFVAMRAIDSLKLMLAPVLPHSSQQIHDFFSYEGALFGTLQRRTVDEDGRPHDVVEYQTLAAERDGIDRWRPSELAPGTPFAQPEPLYKLFDESVVEQEKANLKAQLTAHADDE